jgi:hypothetical protein
MVESVRTSTITTESEMMQTTERVPYLESGEFGYTTDPRRLEGVRNFVSDAVRDGWGIEQTYPGREPVESAATLTRDGFKMMAFARDASGDERRVRSRTSYMASISIWGPDGLAINPPQFYDFDAIQAGVRFCEYCGARDVSTHRVGFAGRACADCLPGQRKAQEYPGWCD